MALAKQVFTVAEGTLLLLFSGLQQQKSQISRRALAPVETTLVWAVRINKRYLAAGFKTESTPGAICRLARQCCSSNSKV
jgi:hypothetical protein